MSTSKAKSRFRKANFVSIILLLAVILAGGIVRSTGSGMGCPDWPKCFGCLVPPVSVSELPKNYKEKYIAQRVVKNQKFAKMLDAMGYNDLARKLRSDKSILVPEEFNAWKTWVEYINRVLGEITGLALLVTAVFAFSYRSESKLIPILSVINLLLIAFQAWLGSIVVSSNLVAWIVTVHMLIALAILALSILTYHLAKVYNKQKLQSAPFVYIIAVLALIVSIFQIVFGTEVREKIDAVSSGFQGGYREDWISNAGQIFEQHRTLAILVLVINAMLFALIRKGYSRHSVQQQIMSFVFLMIMLQIVTGITLSYLALPPFAQAAHILLASLIFGGQFYLMLNLYRSVNPQGAHK